MTKRLIHWLAHLLHWNGCRAESKIENGEIWHRHVCATCGKPGCDWWQFPKNPARR